jgi:hypothetical protein
MVLHVIGSFCGSGGCKIEIDQPIQGRVKASIPIDLLILLPRNDSPEQPAF